MPENGLVTVALCGIGAVIVGLIVLGVALFLRSTGRIVLPSLFGSEETSGIRGRMRVMSPRRARRADLQAQADALDFDAALAQAASQPNQAPQAVPLPPVEPPAPRTRVIQPPWADEVPGLLPDVDDLDDV